MRIKRKSGDQLLCEKIYGKERARELHDKLLSGKKVQIKICGEDHWVSRSQGEKLPVALGEHLQKYIFTSHTYNIFTTKKELWHVEARGGPPTWGSEYLPQFLWSSLAVLGMENPLSITDVARDGCISFFVGSSK